MSLFYVLLLPFLLTAQEPPKIYIAKKACPFECCVYRKWMADQSIDVFDKINGNKKVATLKKGDVVTAITGEVHSWPAAVKVLFDRKNMKKGETVYLLDYVGEGMQRIWNKGEVTIDDMTSIRIQSMSRPACKKIGPSCWGEAEKTSKSVWWSQVKLKDGRMGWTKEGKKFSNNDACGISEAVANPRKETK